MIACLIKVSRGSGVDANGNIDAGDLGPIRCGRKLGNFNGFGENIQQTAAFLVEEVAVLGGVGVEIGAARFDHYLTQQPGLGELVQGVVYGSQGHADTRAAGFGMEIFGGNMAVAVFE